MAREIMVGARRRELARNGIDYNEWWDGIRVNQAQLIAQLNTLKIPGVRTYSIIGRPGECAGVYAWSDAAPPGEFHHIDLSPQDQERVAEAIRNHVAIPEPDSRAELIAEIEDATSLAALKRALVNRIREGKGL